VIKFNYLLTSAGIDLTKVRLVRHQDNRAPRGRTPYDLWRAQNGEFERYQAIQHRDVFSSASTIASFVASPLNETIFVGLYEVLDKHLAPLGTLDPVGGHDVSGLFQYKMIPDMRLDSYAGRLLIDWGVARGPGYSDPTSKIRLLLKYAVKRQTHHSRASPTSGTALTI
jgi:hypothetical protein